MTGYEFSLSFIGLTVLITAYSAFAGYRAVVGTDTVQLLFFFPAFLAAIVVASLILTPTAIGGSSATWAALLDNAVIPDFATVSSFFVLGFGWLLVAMDVWQRNAATRDAKTSTSGNLTGVAVIAAIAIGFVLLGMIDRSYLAQYLENQGSPVLDPVRNFFTYFSNYGVGASRFWVGLFAASIVTAALSTADTFLMVCGHVAMSDWVVGIRRRGSYTDLPADASKALTVFGRAVITALGIIVVVVGLIFDSLGLFVDPYTLFFIAYGAQFVLLGPLLWAAFSKERNARAATVAIVLGVAVSVGYSVALLVGIAAGKTVVYGIDSYKAIYLMPTAAASTAKPTSIP